MTKKQKTGVNRELKKLAAELAAMRDAFTEKVDDTIMERIGQIIEGTGGISEEDGEEVAEMVFGVFEDAFQVSTEEDAK